MATSCNKCLQRRKTSIPSIFCHDCEELLCHSCTDRHKLCKDTTHHEIIPYEDYLKLPPFILKIKMKCLRHGQKYTRFCRIHDQSICDKCLIESHKKCENVPKIEDIVHTVKSSVVFEDTITEMDRMCQKLSEIAKDRKQNLKQLKRRRKKIKKKIEKKIDIIINILQQLKTDKIAKLDSVYNELINDISHTFKTIESEEKKLRSMLDQKDDILKYATNCHTFMGIKEMESIVNEVDGNLNELSKDEKLMEYNLKFHHVNKTIVNIISGIQSLEDVQVTKSPSTVSIHDTKPRYLEAMKEIQPPVKLDLQQTINLERDHEYSGCTLSGGQMVLTGKSFSSSADEDGSYDYDRSCNIFIHKLDGSIRSTRKFNLSEGVEDVTPVDDHHVAVSHPESGTISLIDLNSDRVVRKLNTGEVGVAGLCCRGRNIVCCVEDKGLIKVKIDSGKVETVVVNKSVNDDSHVYVSSGLICYTCPAANTVTVLDTQYNVISTFKDEAMLYCPRDVTIDDNNYIYVTGVLSYNLVVLSPDGRSCHQLLHKDDGLCHPTAVHYDSRTTKLMLVNSEGPAFIYNLAQI